MQQISIWEQESFYAPQGIIIVGAGFTGLWTALHLKQRFPHKKITIIEKGIIPSGASSRNAGFACFGSLTETIADINTMGYEKALQLINWRYLGLKMIRQYFADPVIDYKNNGGFELLDNDICLDNINEINKLVYNITNATETYLQNDELIKTFGFEHTKHIIANKFEGTLHSGKLLLALAQMVQCAGVQIMCNTELKQVEEMNNCVRLYTSLPQNLKADQVIFCTNAFSKMLLPDMDIIPARGQVLLTEPIKGLKMDGCFHYDEGFYYFRNLDGRVLLGGARNTSFETEYTYDDVTTLTIQQQLENFLTTFILPGQKPVITHRWAGIMAMGSEKFPIVRQLAERSFCAVRLSGMGVALAPIMGKIISEMV